MTTKLIAESTAAVLVGLAVGGCGSSGGAHIITMCAQARGHNGLGPWYACYTFLQVAQSAS